MNWRVYEESSNGLFTELATHQTDIANWFMRAVPKRVHTFAGLDYWRDGRDTDDNILLSFEYEQNPGDPGFIPIDQRSKLQKLNLINRGYQVRFVYSSILANAKRGASELIQGDKGTIELSEDKCWMFGEDYTSVSEENLSAEELANKTGSGGTRNPTSEELKAGVELLGDVALKTPDVYQFRAFAECIKNGTVPRSNQMVGFTTALTAIYAVQSKKEGKVVDIDPAVYTFDFETPSFHEYDSWDEETKARV